VEGHAVQPVTPVPVDTGLILRRSVALAVGLAAAAVLVLAVYGSLGFALMLCVGIALGILNSCLVHRSALRYGAGAAVSTKRMITMGVLPRLALITLVALTLAILFRPAGIGVLVGLAVFQLVTIVTSSMSMLKELRKT
jgi:hypothetical protein